MPSVRQGETCYTVNTMREAVETALEGVRIALNLHAGGIELLDVNSETGVVQVRLTGMCSGCELSSVTMKEGISVVLHEQVPGITEVIAVA